MSKRNSKESRRKTAPTRAWVRYGLYSLGIFMLFLMLAYGLAYAIGVSHDDGAVALLHAQGNLLDIEITGYTTGSCDGGHFRSSFKATRIEQAAGSRTGIKEIPVSGYVCSSLFEASTVHFR